MVIRHLFNLRRNARRIFDEMCEKDGEHTPSYRTIARWVANFKTGHMGVEDAPGRVGQIKSLQFQTISSLQCEISFSSSAASVFAQSPHTLAFPIAIRRAIADKLELGKLHAYWVPWVLSGAQKSAPRKCATNFE